MPTPTQVLYTALRRTISSFQRERIPFTGLVGTDFCFWNCNAAQTTEALFKSSFSPFRFEEAVKLLPSLNVQLNTLSNAEEHTRQALHEWSLLTDSCAQDGFSNPFAPAIAAERGMNLICSQIADLEDPVLQFTKELDADDDGEEAAASLDELAQRVRNEDPALFPENNISIGVDAATATATASSSEANYSLNNIDTQKQQLETLRDVLYKQYKLGYTPFEWVYEGLSPIILPDVLKKRRGSPVALAIAAASVGRRVGLPLIPLPLPGIFSSKSGLYGSFASSRSDGSGIQNLSEELELPPELAFRLQSQAKAGGPESVPWILELASLDQRTASSDSNNANMAQLRERVYLDAANGDILSAQQVSDRFPDRVHLINPSPPNTRADSTTTAGGGVRIVTGAGPAWSPLVSWRGLVRTMLQAHQRRGESDMVAHWLYVLLALDTSAPEWEPMLQGPAVATA